MAVMLVQGLLGMRPADSEPPPRPTGVQVLPRRWVVERTFAWLGWYRRLKRIMRRFQRRKRRGSNWP
jgi:transposase